ncbi:MAG: ATP-binding domain-containing protein [Desulfobacteraceae bacterium]|nr:ATP-binding domain-containing protein [Desulfobacteraceae bacterium]
MISNAGEIDSEQLITSDSGQVILEQIFAVVERARILSIVRKGSYGCVGVNYQICEHLYSKFDDKANSNIFPGAVIMVTRNDYSKELFNGDVGVVLRDPKGTYRAFFPRFGSYISFAVDMLPPWEHAFAMTVHKSQGSEFDDVLLVLPEDEAHRLLTREIVYTGITRAKKRIIIYGKESALATALERKIERQSGLTW